MDSGPDQKRPRLSGPSTAWQNSPDPNRHTLPPIHSPYSRSEGPQAHNPLDRPPYDHHQDPRRPNSGPPHTFYPPHSSLPQPPYPGPRDPNPMVKRDPSDEPHPPQYHRPPSTGNGPDHNVNLTPHHEPPNRPHYDPTRPQTYQPSPDPIRSQSYQQNSFPPTPSSMPAPEYNPYQNNGLPTPRDQYPSVTYPSASAAQRSGNEQIRKKAQRAAQACDSCRTLKAKCDEGRPSCTTCKEKGVDCKYRDPPPKQQDKQTADIVESIHNLHSFIKAKFDDFQVQINDIRRMQQMPVPNTERVEQSPKQETEESSKLHETIYSMPSVASESQTFLNTESPYASTPGHQRIPERVERVEQVEQVDTQAPPRSQEEDSEEDTVGAPRPARDSTMPVNHTTGAARLLLVRPIREMCKEIMANARIKNEMFPIVTEERRGLLRVYGRGEGHDSIPGYEKDPIVDHGADTPDDAHSNVSSPGPGDEWGQCGGFTPPASHEHTPRDFTRGEINSLGMPDFSPQTVLDLVKSYKENMNNMHPILAPRKLDDLVETFLKSIQEDKARPRQIEKVVATHSHTSRSLPAGFVTPGGIPESPGNKRKRSSVGDYAESQSFPEFKPGHPNRTMTSCIVLLCMALGKICLHHSRLPDYEFESDKHSEGSWASPVLRNGYPPSPLHHSSPSMSTPILMGSPPDMERVQSRSRRTSIEGVFPPRITPPKPRNIDIIPGLVYYAMATDIIGNQLGGNDLPHVHANILASLYQGQLGRVMESHGFLAAACRAIQVQLRVRMDRFKKIKEKADVPPPKDNALVVAFWTCLQLESDILAELPVPHSNILTYEEDMPPPNLAGAIDIHGFDRRVMESYLTQLQLRKHLNTLHRIFYKPDNDTLMLVGEKARVAIDTVEVLETMLNDLIKSLPSNNFTWDIEKGELASDILGARLRAKCYGAQVITYRPFIKKILESPLLSSGLGDHTNGFVSHINLPDIAEEFYPKVVEYARKGMTALINSTRAFHGLGNVATKRLIVTNVWGTAHAQWGNMMVLQAAYMNPILKPMLLDLITLDGLRDLFTNTMSFLRLHATKTSALMIDWRILENTGRKTDLYMPSNPTSSFGSTPGDVSMSGH